MSKEPRKTCYTPTPGKQPTSIPCWKYDAVREAILQLVPKHEPGVVAKALPGMVGDFLDLKVREKLGSVAWHTTTVKLNMEVEGELRRVDGVKPQHLVRI